MVTPLAWAARISTRLKPNVIAPLAGREASRSANSEKPIAAASASMCPASESRASEFAITPVATSTAMKATIRPSATVSLPRSAPAVGAVGVSGVIVGHQLSMHDRGHSRPLARGGSPPVGDLSL